MGGSGFAIRFRKSCSFCLYSLVSTFVEGFRKSLNVSLAIFVQSLKLESSWARAIVALMPSARVLMVVVTVRATNQLINGFT